MPATRRITLPLPPRPDVPALTAAVVLFARELCLPRRSTPARASSHEHCANAAPDLWPGRSALPVPELAASRAAPSAAVWVLLPESPQSSSPGSCLRTLSFLSPSHRESLRKQKCRSAHPSLCLPVVLAPCRAMCLQLCLLQSVVASLRWLPFR